VTQPRRSIGPVQTRPVEPPSALQNRRGAGPTLGLTGARPHPDVHQQNARLDTPLRLERNHTLWIENSIVPASWQLTNGHVLTGIPDNTWDLRLEADVCIDIVPVGDDGWCLRPSGMDDPFTGPIGQPGTSWLWRRAPALRRGPSRWWPRVPRVQRSRACVPSSAGGTRWTLLLLPQRSLRLPSPRTTGSEETRLLSSGTMGCCMD